MPDINIILENLNANYAQITDLVPNLYNFTDDITYAVDEFEGIFSNVPLGQQLFRLSSGKLIWIGASGADGNTVNVRRFTSDYELDSDFEPIYFDDGNNGLVRHVAEQSDGKIIIGGNFTVINGDSYGYIARINTDGTVDSTFNAEESGFNDVVLAIKVLSDDSIFVAGNFTNYNGTSITRICKLDSDGVLQGTEVFDPPTINDSIMCLEIDEVNEKIYLGGYFETSLKRLNFDGSEDTDFNAGEGFNDRVSCLALDSDGKLMVGGWFEEFNGVACNTGIVRVTTESGSSKNITNIAVSSGGTSTITCNNHGLQNGNVVIITGSNSDADIDGNWIVTVVNSNTFTINSPDVTVAGSSGTFVSAPGNIDSSFDTEGLGLENNNISNLLVQTLAIQSNGKILVGGWFNLYNEQRQGHIIRFNTDGTKDTSFLTGFGFNDQQADWGDGDYNSRINNLLINADGSILCTGNLGAYDFVPVNGFAKLSSTGQLSSTQILKYAFVAGIEDGNEDMYDGGNYLNTDLTQIFENIDNQDVDDDEILKSQSIPITHTPATSNEAFRDTNGDPSYVPLMDGIVKDGTQYFGSGSSYFTNMYPGMFVLVATDVSIDEFSVTGDIGSDGNTLNNTNVQIVINGKTYTVFIKNNIENGGDDPSINHLIIVPGSPGAITQTVNNDGNGADDHLVRGLEGRKELYYILTSRAEAAPLSFEDAYLVAEKFISFVDASDPEINATFDISPLIRNLGTDGSLDVFDENGLSVQRTLNGVLLERNGEYKMVGEIKDGQEFNNIVETLADYPNIKAL